MSFDFSKKKITLMGLGLLGRGLGDAKFLAAAGAELIVTDFKTEEELAPSLAALKSFPHITFHLGDHHLEDFEDRDLIIRAPNAPLDSPFLAHARERGIPVEMDASLFAKLTRATIVGVTGTRGKSTVTHLIYEMVHAAGRKVYLGGNEKDTATLPLLDVVGPDDLVVLELDSWQLQGFEESKISPSISVWTNFMPDHMNYYHGDMDRYFQDKAAIARFQKAGDYFVTTPEIKEKIEERFGTPLATSVLVDATSSASLSHVLSADWEVALPGEHNRANAAMAVAAAGCLSIPDEVIKEVLKTFSGLPNRLEFLGTNNGIDFYNDSNSTTPEATIAALRTLAPQSKPIVLIAGGSDKDLDFAELAKIIAENKSSETAKIKNLILFEGKATEKLRALLPAAPQTTQPVTIVATMKTALEAALAAAVPGDIILLSPAATSFGLFKNEYDRGEQFKQLVLSAVSR